MIRAYVFFQVENFPFGLFEGCTTFAAFVVEVETILVPILLYKTSEDSVSAVMLKLAKWLGKKDKQILKDNFVALAGIYLPQAASKVKYYFRNIFFLYFDFRFKNDLNFFFLNFEIIIFSIV
jgi:hypothetical protein